MKSAKARTLLLLLWLAPLAGCSNVDLHQAELCEEAARILFAESRIDALASATDTGAAHAVITTVAVRDADGLVRRHRVSCGFSGSGPKSDDLLALTQVSIDDAGPLDEAAITELHASLERKGVYWKVSWIPTFGGPHGELAPASPEMAALYFL